MKKFKLSEVDDLQVSGSASATPDVDWNLCFICQFPSDEDLTCPGNYANRFKKKGYSSLAENLQAFQKLGVLPDNFALVNCINIEETLVDNSAKFHDRCRLRFNKTELQRAQNRKRKLDEAIVSVDVEIDEKRQDACQSPCKTRGIHSSQSPEVRSCFFCDYPESEGRPVHRVSTFGFDAKVRLWAYNLKDTKLIAKLEALAGDMMAKDIVYHDECATKLFNRERNRVKSSVAEANVKYDETFVTAFAELISYIRCTIDDEETAPVFKLSRLKSILSKRIEQIGGNANIHSTRLKNDILSNFPDLRAQHDGREVILVAKENIGASLRKACDYDAQQDAVILARAANIVRKQILNRSRPSFNGSFDLNCQQESVPHTLTALVSMIMFGSNIESGPDYQSQPALSIAQLITFNTFERRKSAAGGYRRTIRQETPLPMFIGSFIHSHTRSKDIVSTLNFLGLSVSYDRVLSLSADLGNTAIKHYETLGAVVPSILRYHIFTVGAVDNIDHNPSSTSAQSAFHGTGISLFQQPDSESPGIVQNGTSYVRGGKKLSALPISYTSVPPAVKCSLSVSIPPCSDFQEVNTEYVDLLEREWCERTCKLLTDCSLETVRENSPLSWAAFHSQRLTDAHYKTEQPAISALLPLFPEDSKSVAMMKHAMDVVREAVVHLNPGQIPILACDQPLFKIAKEIQWSCLSSYGEDKMVILLGGLHIKMSLLKALGEILSGSGWQLALEQSQVASSGTADSFLRVTHVKRTERAHQITALALFCLLTETYQNYCIENTPSPPLSFQDWCEERRSVSPQFQYWEMILNTQLQFLSWDRSVHEGNFDLYISSLWNLQWLFHSLDHINYIRAVAIHLRDMMSLSNTHPSVYAAFCQGKFSLNKSGRPFSKMPIDECHEQNNDLVKSEGGAIGLTENSVALLRWMVAGPEMMRVVNQFLSCLQRSNDIPDEIRHHENVPSVQNKFACKVISLVKTLKDMGNPFDDSSGDLLTLDTREIADLKIASSMKNIKKMGEDLFTKFWLERIVEHSKPLSDVIRKNNIPLFSRPPIKIQSRDKVHIEGLKKDRNLLSSLYIACQVREGDLQQFFSHENHGFPPSLSDNGKLKLNSNKSDLLQSLQRLTSDDAPIILKPPVNMLVIDGAVSVHYTKPMPTHTFDDYCTDFVSNIEKEFQSGTQRIDIIFDVYLPDSLKNTARQERGSGTRIRVEGSKKIPQNWSNFLKVEGNKKELFELLANRVSGTLFPGTVIVTKGQEALCSEASISLDNISPCNHEEADSRMILHAHNGFSSGLHTAMIKTCDTDVVVLAVGLAAHHKTCQLRVDFGAGKWHRFINATSIANALGPERSLALRAFHALTGCDTTSMFRGIGKNKAFSTWNVYPDVTSALCVLSQVPSPENVKDLLPSLERFVIIMYNRCSTDENVNAARQTLFRTREIENIPPTQAALYQHLLRVAFQAGHVWGQATERNPELPSPENFGWKKNLDTLKWDVRYSQIK